MGLVLSLLLVPLNCWATDYTQDGNAVCAWLMEIDENPLTDSTGNGETLVLKGAGEPNFATAFPPAAYTTGYYDWDGSNDYASSGIDLSGGNIITAVFWLNWDVYANDDKFLMEFTSNTSSGNNGFLIIPNSGAPVAGKLQFFMRDNSAGAGYGVRNDRTNFPVDTWVHWAVIFDKTQGSNIDQIKLWGGGTEETATKVVIGGNDNNLSENFSNDTLYVGSRANTSYFGDMFLDEVALFNDALTNTEINDIMDNGLEGAVAAVGQIIPVTWSDF